MKGATPQEALEDAKALLDDARANVANAEQNLTRAKALYSEAWACYETAAREAGQVQVVVKSYSHLLEGSLVMERRARFCDMTGEEITEGTGAKVVITKGESRWEADLCATALATVLESLNDPEEKKKRGRPTANGSTPEAEAEKPEPETAAKK